MKSKFLVILILLFGCSSSDEPIAQIETFNFTTVIEPLNSGTISPNLGTFKKGKTVIITAKPSSFYAFKHWTNLDNNKDNPLQLIMKNDIELHAFFKKIDDDEDGILNDKDLCKRTEKGEDVDTNGCAASEKLDDDLDGIINGMDLCSNTPTGTKVNNKGCAIIQDIDGNEYGTIKIGTQVWMSENLKTSKLNDGVQLQNLQDDKQWSETTKPAFSMYDNDSKNSTKYGHLYNYYATTKNICPDNWRVSTKEDWDELIEFAGGLEKAGEHLKETGLDYWFSPNDDFSTNQFGFNARGNGARFSQSSTFQFDGIKRAGSFWSSKQDDNDTNKAIAFILSFSTRKINQTSRNKTDGYAIRCIKN